MWAFSSFGNVIYQPSWGCAVVVRKQDHTSLRCLRGFPLLLKHMKGVHISEDGRVYAAHTDLRVVCFAPDSETPAWDVQLSSGWEHALPRMNGLHLLSRTGSVVAMLDARTGSSIMPLSASCCSLPRCAAVASALGCAVSPDGTQTAVRDPKDATSVRLLPVCACDVSRKRDRRAVQHKSATTRGSSSQDQREGQKACERITDVPRGPLAWLDNGDLVCVSEADGETVIPLGWDSLASISTVSNWEFAAGTTLSCAGGRAWSKHHRVIRVGAGSVIALRSVVQYGDYVWATHGDCVYVYTINCNLHKYDAAGTRLWAATATVPAVSNAHKYSARPMCVCVSADGAQIAVLSQLTTVDGSIVACFDTGTGAEVGSTRIVAGAQAAVVHDPAEVRTFTCKQLLVMAGIGARGYFHDRCAARAGPSGLWRVCFLMDNALMEVGVQESDRQMVVDASPAVLHDGGDADMPLRTTDRSCLEGDGPVNTPGLVRSKAVPALGSRKLLVCLRYAATNTIEISSAYTAQQCTFE